MFCLCLLLWFALFALFSACCLIFVACGLVGLHDIVGMGLIALHFDVCLEGWFSCYLFMLIDCLGVSGFVLWVM